MLGVVAMEVVWFIAGGALGTFIGALLGYMIACFSIVYKRSDRKGEGDE